VKQRYINLLYRYARIIAAVTVIAAVAALAFSALRPATHEAKARLIIGPGIESLRPDLNTLRAGGQIMQTYAEVASTEPFLQDVINELKLSETPDELMDMIDTMPNQETQILTITVRHNDAEKARAIANAIANRMVRLSPSNTESQAAQIKGQIQTRAGELDQTINDIKLDIQQLQADYRVAVEQENRPIPGVNQDQLTEFGSQSAALASASTQAAAGASILNALIENASARLGAFQQDLSAASNTATRQFVSQQIRTERIRLSELQKVLVEIQSPVNGVALDKAIQNSEARLTELEDKLATMVAVDLRRLQLDQIARERDTLTNARALEATRQEMVLNQIAEERDRMSEVEMSRIEKQRLITDQIAVKNGQLSEAQNTLALLYTSLQEADPNQVQIIEPASRAVPIRSNLLLSFIIGGLAGLLLSVVAVFGYDYFSDRIESAEDMREETGLAVIDLDRSQPNPMGRRGPVQERAEGYRMLGELVMTRGEATGARTLLIGSADNDANSGLAAANLATFLTQLKKKVILVDADPSNASVTRAFGLGQQPGLSELLADPRTPLSGVVSTVGYDNLLVLPVGTAHNGEMLAPAALAGLIEDLRQQADYILVAGPTLAGSDAMLLASKVAGVILLANKGQTTRQRLSEVLSNLKLAGARGMVAAVKENQPDSLWFVGRAAEEGAVRVYPETTPSDAAPSAAD